MDNVGYLLMKLYVYRHKGKVHRSLLPLKSRTGMISSIQPPENDAIGGGKSVGASKALYASFLGAFPF